MKKFFVIMAMLLMTTIAAVIPASASGFSKENILGGESRVRGEFKGSHGGLCDEYYSLSQSGSVPFKTTSQGRSH